MRKIHFMYDSIGYIYQRDADTLTVTDNDQQTTTARLDPAKEYWLGDFGTMHVSQFNSDLQLARYIAGFSQINL